MTDREPGPPDPATPHPGAPRPDAPSGTAVQDRWWWSPTLALVVGVVVVGYQLEALRGPDPIVLNWVVAAVGLASALFGAVGLLRAYRSR